MYIDSYCNVWSSLRYGLWPLSPPPFSTFHCTFEAAIAAAPSHVIAPPTFINIEQLREIIITMANTDKYRISKCKTNINS